MRVTLLAETARKGNAVGNHIAEIARFFLDRGSEVRLYLQDAVHLHPALVQILEHDVNEVPPVFLLQCDLVFVVYAGDYAALNWLPLIAGNGPRIVFDYLGVTPAEYWPSSNRERLERDARRRGVVWFADYALTMSASSRNELLEAADFPREFVATQPLCVDAKRFFPKTAEANRTRRQLRIDGAILLFVGRLAGNKRVSMVIEALARLDDRNCHAVIVGDTSDIYAAEAERCRELAGRLGVADRVHLLGSVDDAELPSLYRAADLLVMPSLHEGFCLPVIEAQASGLPVVAARATALPETVADGGLTFIPDDVRDLVRQIERIRAVGGPKCQPMDRVKRIAIVSFRYGSEIIGGAETSLRTIAANFRQLGHGVEVFTTRTRSESLWADDLPAGSAVVDGIPVHRYSIDPHDANAYRAAQADPGSGADYLRHSIHSTALIASLRQRESEFDAILAGPYLFGLTADVAQAFPEKTLIVPCFHDEPLARLAIWPGIFRCVAGWLYHSEEEQTFAQTELGINHPNTAVIGTVLSDAAFAERSPIPCILSRPYVVYCGRYSEHKNLPLLLDWMQRFQAIHPGQLDLVLTGEGEFRLPSESWLRDLGRVDETTKRAVLCGARALVQLSARESLSLVALEAWAAGTPIIAHRDCAVLVGQIHRSAGGAIVGDQDEFVDVLTHLLTHASAWSERGARGLRYIQDRYTDPTAFAERIASAIERTRAPLRDLLIQRGLERAAAHSRPAWQKRFAEFVDQVLTQPARSANEELQVEVLRKETAIGVGVRTHLIPIRITNTGGRAAIGEGAARTVICCETKDAATGRLAVARQVHAFVEILQPKQSVVLPIAIALPAVAGRFRVRIWCERLGAESPISLDVCLHLSMLESEPSPVATDTPAATFLDVVNRTLPRAHQAKQLPSEYVDVTEGLFAPVKRFIKRKVLHNFKHAFVDVLSRRQSQVNNDMVLMVQQLTECCTMLDQAIAGLNRRIDVLEAQIAERSRSNPLDFATDADHEARFERMEARQ